MRRSLVAVVALATLLLGATQAARAQSAIDVTSTNAEISFPQGITFTLDANVSGLLSDVRIDYQVAPDGVRTTAVPQCTTGQAVHCTFDFVNSEENPLIPGAVVTYSWTLTSGSTTQDTPSQTVTYMDTRYDWKTISDGNLTLWYYNGSASDARAVLEAGRQSIDQTSALIDTHVDIPLKIFDYETADAMQPAIVANNAPGVITLGEVVYSDTAMVSQDYSPQDIARHEVAHIVQRAAMAGAYVHNEPDWLNEGTAVHAQTQPLQDQRAAIDAAIRTGDVISVRSMSSASSGASSATVNLFYGEAWSLVKFLIDTYGQDKFAQLFVALKTGSTTGRALQQVYGFNEDGFENAWRAGNGLPPRTPVATRAPTPSPTRLLSKDHFGGNDRPMNVIIGVIIGTILIAGGLIVLGVVLARRL